MSSQTIRVIGYLTNDPESVVLPSGTQKTTFNVATNRKYNDSQGQQVEETTYFRCFCFGKQAEAQNQYLSKGSLVDVQGRLAPSEYGTPRIWTNNAGEARAAFEVFAEKIDWLKLNDSPSRQTGAPEYGTGGYDPNDDVPF